jgi:hypothetical protein
MDEAMADRAPSSDYAGASGFKNMQKDGAARDACYCSSSLARHVLEINSR